ncbi:hypothetical protein ABW19_dt0208065 [Dactylella cylindrospora]|nr:hypothetical protein ABW19_dt0208065 [Dactylella cylindrospora]
MLEKQANIASGILAPFHPQNPPPAPAYPIPFHPAPLQPDSFHTALLKAQLPLPPPSKPTLVVVMIGETRITSWGPMEFFKEFEFPAKAATLPHKQRPPPPPSTLSSFTPPTSAPNIPMTTPLLATKLSKGALSHLERYTKKLNDKYQAENEGSKKIWTVSGLHLDDIWNRDNDKFAVELTLMEHDG